MNNILDLSKINDDADIGLESHVHVYLVRVHMCRVAQMLLLLCNCNLNLIHIAFCQFLVQCNIHRLLSARDLYGGDPGQ